MEQLYGVAIALVPKWSSLTQHDISFSPLSGGITNKLFKGTSSTQKPNIVLFRVYGENTELIIDRGNEIITFRTLHSFRLGPRFYGTYHNGCVYGFVEGRELSAADMLLPAFSDKIAAKLALWHKNIVIKEFEKKPTVFNAIQKYAAALPSTFTEKHCDNLEQLDKYEKLNLNIQNEIQFLNEFLKTYMENSPVVYCHNDLLSGNIIYYEKKDSITFVDYEYSCYNYRAFDIANHFCEYMGFEMDRQKFPSEQHQKVFLKKYLQEYYKGVKEVITDEDVEKMFEELLCFLCMPHFYWGVWALAQSVLADIDFDYFGYAIERLTCYFELKNKLTSK